TTGNSALGTSSGKRSSGITSSSPSWIHGFRTRTPATTPDSAHERKRLGRSMPVDLSKSLVIGVSSRALFDLEEANHVFETQGEAAYTKFQQGREKEVLQPGIGFRLVQAILGLNQKARGSRKAEVVVASRNSPATSFRLFNSIQHHQLDIQRAIL